MKVKMINIHSKKTELEFEVNADRSLLSFTERLISIRKRNDTGNLVTETEIDLVIDSMKNSGVFDTHPHCVVIIEQ